MKHKSSNNTNSDRFFQILRQGTQALQYGQVEKARRLLEHAHNLDSDHPAAVLNLASAYILSKRFKKAARLLEPLSQREPDNPMVWTNLGAAYLGNPVLAQDKQQQQAIAAFKKALVLDPRTPHVAYNLGLIYHDRQEYDEALRWFKSALETNPNDKDARQYIEKLSSPD